MTFEIKDYFETPVILEPRVELYKEQMRKNSSLFLQNLLKNLLA